jgi:hypothetical protein
MAALESHLDEEEFDFGPTTQKGIEYRTNGPFTGRWIVIVQGHSNEKPEDEEDVPHELKVVTIDIAEKGDSCTHAKGHVETLVPSIIRDAKKYNAARLLDGIHQEVVDNLHSKKDRTLKFRTGNGSISTITNKYLNKSWNLFEKDEKGKKTNHGNVYIYDNDSGKTTEVGIGKKVYKADIFKTIHELIIETKPVDQQTPYDHEILLISFGCNKFTSDVTRKEKAARQFGHLDDNFSKHERDFQEYNRQINTDGVVVNALNFFAGKRTRSKNKKKRSRRL